MSKRIVTNLLEPTKYRNANDHEKSNFNLIRVYDFKMYNAMTGIYAVIIADDNKFEGL